MKKNLTRLLSVLLALVLTIGVLPVSALADGWRTADSLEREQSASMAESVETQAATTTDNFRIVHLDCGRKYFSVENIEKLIDTMSQYGYNQLQLAFGNGGCRFLLDDMSLSFNGTTMSSATVKTNITNGNNAFNGDTRYLTQADMDSIITYANSKGIEIVPMLNMPGHATAIVYGTSYASSGNLNVNNEDARNYGTALLKKYVDYFKGKGCKYFHFGSDESGYTGTDMTTFLTACAKVITDAGMTPRAFNDATNVATMPTSVQITYWHQESGSKTASALASAGYSMINTHGRWYYVIKTAQNSEIGTKYWQGTVNTSATSVELPVLKAEKMDNKWVGINEYFDGNPGYGSTVSGSLGTMFCIWCDASQDAYLTDSDVISENENYGALYQIEKLAEHYWPDDIKKSTAPTVTQVDGSALPTAIKVGEALNLRASKTVSWTTSDNSVIELTSPANGESETIKGTSVLAIARGSGTATITVTDEDGNTASYTIKVQDASQAETINVALTVGESKTFDVDSSVNAGSYITGKDVYIATAEVAKGEAQSAELKAVTEIESGKSYLIVNQRSGLLLTDESTTWTSRYTSYNCLKLSGTASATSTDLWTLTGSGSTYTAASGGKYMTIGSNTATMSSASSNLTFSCNNSGYWNISYSNYYLNNLGGGTGAGGWKDNSAPTDSGSKWTIYEIVPGKAASNTLTITGVGEAETDVTVGNVTYHITVTAPEKTDSTTLSHGGSFTLPNGAADVTVTSGRAYVTANGTTITAGNTDGTATITYTVKNDGSYVTARYTHTVTVSAIDFVNIEPLEVQLWITNTWVGADSAPTSLQTVNISAKDAYSEAGVALSRFVPGTGYKKDGSNTVRVTYWKGVTLHNGIVPVQQGADYTNSGDNFTTIRYWNNAWQYLNGTEWTTIVTTDTIVAYYLQLNNVSPEITTGTKDYGNPPTAHPGSGNYGLTAFAVVYPDGTLSRTEQQMYETGMVCGFWGKTEYDLGTIYAENNSTYRISKMTVTWGANINGISGSDWYTGTYTADDVYGTDWGVEWEKVTNSAGKKWYNETTYWEAGDSDIPMIDGDKFNLKITTTKNAALILIYLEVVETENTLNVVYWDDNTDTQITTNPMPIPIVVDSDVTFITGIQNSGTMQAGKITLSDDAYIENSSGAKQGFNKELSTVPGVSGVYVSGLFKYVSAEISEDGMTLTLHFDLNAADFENTYVVDFGLPLVIKPEDFEIVNIASIKSVSLESGAETLSKPGTYGTAKIEGDWSKVTYTLSKPLGSSRATIPLYVHFNDGTTKLFQAHVIPASNVLYEENFLTTDSLDWTRDSSSTLTTAQETQKLDASDTTTYNVFGTDGAYVEALGETGVWKAGTTDNPLSTKKPTGLLTTSFYGNAFDLIGNCGVDTGRVVMIISPVDKNSGARTRILDIDTRYNKGTLNQVPLAHVVLDKDAEYKVEIMASGLDAKTVTPTNASAVAVMSAPSASADELLLSVVRRYGLSMANVERISVNDTFSAASVSTASVSAVSDAAMFAEPQADSIKYQQGTHVEIDSFRVYRTADEKDAVAQNYPAAEQNITYWNILDVLQGQTITAYTENGDVADYAVESYEAAGGPQNEIYIGENQAIAFKIAGVDSIQVSLRAVDKTATWADGNGSPYTLNTNTEMYYTLNSVGDVFTIANNTDQLLAIGNVKLGKDVDVTDILPASEIDEQVLLENLRAAFGVSSVEPEPELFQPSTFDAKVSSMRLIRNKLVTIRISVSSDVSYVTVNGVKYWPGRLTRWQKTGYVQFLDTIGRYESKTYTIVAYDANGVASAPITVNG